jgi:sialate O-acetylesterase
MKIFRVAIVALLWMSAASLRADVTLPKFLSDHMVLQRNMPIHVWGHASPGEEIKVALEKDSAAATADALGRWSVNLPARPAGGPYTLTIRGKNTVEVNDILIGDLWFASGQSNMEIPLKGFPNSAVIKDADKEIASANYPQIRLLRIRKATSEYPLDDRFLRGGILLRPRDLRAGEGSHRTDRQHLGRNAGGGLDQHGCAQPQPGDRAGDAGPRSRYGR